MRKGGGIDIGRSGKARGFVFVYRAPMDGPGSDSPSRIRSSNQYRLKGPCGVNLKGLLKVWDGARHTLFPVAGIWRSAPYRSCRLPAPRRYSMRQHMTVGLITGPSTESLPSILSEASQHGSPQVCRLRSAAPARVSTTSRTLYLFPRGRPLPRAERMLP